MEITPSPPWTLALLSRALPSTPWSGEISRSAGQDLTWTPGADGPRPAQEVLEEWLNCQRAWLYLEPIFSSEDINRQLPVESKRYQTMERIWRKIMKNAYENREASSRGAGRGCWGLPRPPVTLLAASWPLLSLNKQD